MINEKCAEINDNKYFIGCMMIIVTIGGRFIINEFNETQKELINNPIIKKIIIFCAFFMATRDIQIAIILTILFTIVVKELFNDHEDYKNIEKEDNKNNKINQIISLLNEINV